MTDWKGLTQEMERLLRLRNYPVAYKRLEDAKDLENIPKIRRLDRPFTFCQVPALVRIRGWTIGITAEDNIWSRCSRINGLADATEGSMAEESVVLGNTWLASGEQAMKQQAAYPRIPKGEALVLAPLASGKFEPDIVLIYETPARLMMMLCGLQKIEFERFKFFFVGEGACADSLAQCYVSQKPSLALPCFGERRFGEVRDEELVLALPAAFVEKAVEGMLKLSSIGFRFPIPFYGAEHDPLPALG
jgi:uncharacterized protein (DUF169 family)